MRRLLLILGILLVTIPASATTRYIAASAGTFTGGSACNGQTAITPATWNATSESAGDISYICGPLTTTAGSVLLNVQWSGTNGNPIFLIADTGASLQAPYFPGTTASAACAASCGGIETIGQSYVIIDGGTNGLIQNTLNGSALMGCLGGPCTQGASGSVGIGVSGTEIIVRNWNVNNIYISCGITNCTDGNAALQNNADIRVYNGATGIEVCNNNVAQAYIGISTDTAESATTPTVSLNCQSNAAPTGTNLFQNTTSDICHHFQPTGSGPLNIWMNDVGGALGYTDWIWPKSGTGCHTDGIISFSDSTTPMLPNIYDNYFHGDLGNGSPTGFVFCTYGTAHLPGGSNCTVFNDLFVGSGYMAKGNDAHVFVQAGAGTPQVFYNCTFVIGGYAFDMEGDSTTHMTWENLVIFGLGSVTNMWAWHNENATVWATLDFTNTNDFYNLRANAAWNYNSTTYNSLAAWVTGCKTGTGFGAGNCDDASITTNPLLAGGYQLMTGSPAIGTGANLTSLGITALDYGAPSTFGYGSTFNGVLRPTVGNWDMGAFPYVAPGAGCKLVGDALGLNTVCQ